MAWITLEEARAACGASAGAAAVLAWLDGLGAVVRTGRTPVASRLYARKYLLAQEVVTETREVRGLARGLAAFLADGLRSSNLVEHTYYALISAKHGSGTTWDYIENVPVSVTAGPRSATSTSVDFCPGGGVYSVRRSFNLPTEGREVAAEARRANEADGWTVALTETVYGVPYTNDGKNVFVPDLPDIAKTGAVVSKSSSRTYVFSFAGAVLFQTETTTVTEYTRLTQAEAAQKVADNTADASYVRVSKASGGVTVWREVRSGTQKTASARYVDAENGWTVSVTAVAYGHTGW